MSQSQRVMSLGPATTRKPPRCDEPCPAQQHRSYLNHQIRWKADPHHSRVKRGGSGSSAAGIHGAGNSSQQRPQELAAFGSAATASNEVSARKGRSCPWTWRVMSAKRDNFLSAVRPPRAVSGAACFRGLGQRLMLGPEHATDHAT